MGCFRGVAVSGAFSLPSHYLLLLCRAGAGCYTRRYPAAGVSRKSPGTPLRPLSRAPDGRLWGAQPPGFNQGRAEAEGSDWWPFRDLSDVPVPSAPLSGCVQQQELFAGGAGRGGQPRGPRERVLCRGQRGRTPNLFGKLRAIVPYSGIAERRPHLFFAASCSCSLPF